MLVVALLPLLGLLVWQAVVVVAEPAPWLLPSPAGVVRTLIDEHSRLWYHAQPTLRATLLGFGIATISGLMIATAISLSRAIDAAVYPWVVALQAIPLLTLAPPLTVWLDYTTTQVVLATAVCIFPVIVSAVDGLRTGDPQRARALRTLGAGPAWTWRHVTLPAALPSLFSGLRMAAVYSVSGAVVAEYVGSDRGLGYLTEFATAQFQTDVAFAAITWLGAIGVGLFLLVNLVERIALPYRHRATQPRWRRS